MKITVLQWNVWYWEKADNILKALKELNADILCLQEVTQDSDINPGRDLPAEIKSLGYYEYHEYTPYAAGQKPGSLGSGIFSKTPLHACRQHETLKAEPGRLDPDARLYLQADTTINGNLLTVGTTQLSWTPAPEFPESDYKRLEAKTLADIVSNCRQRFILAGDFNALPGSETVNRFDKLLVPAGPDYSEATWTTKPHDFGDRTIDSLLWRLDYVYATPDIKVLSSRTISTEYSDHLPILVEIEV
jgi:endonuclease/exonuclease/phosphatase family metal-dependent hydrolase